MPPRNSEKLKKLKQREHIILIALACALLGFVLARQFYLHKNVTKVTQPDQQQGLALEVSQLFAGNKDLQSELTNLQLQFNSLQKSSQNLEAAQNSLKRSIEQNKIISGEVPVKGPGVILEFQEKLESYQITDLVNALRNIGAEAIAINNKRIGPTTGWDNGSFKPPYTIYAIGNPGMLKDALTRRGGIMEQMGFTGNVKEEKVIHLSQVK